MGEGRRRCRSGPWDEGTVGVHKGNFHIPDRMVVRGGEETGHVTTGVTYVTEDHSFLVKGTLTHLALCVLGGGTGKRGGEGRYGPGRG